MTQDKELLLKDLCARLPYGVKVYLNTDMYPKWTGDYILTAIKSQEYSVQSSVKHFSCWCNIRWVKPYLFPLSSMTEEQKKELENLGWNFDNFEIHNVSECLGTYIEYVAHSDCFNLIDWLNKNHFDYRGLIPKGLAIDATGLNVY